MRDALYERLTAEERLSLTIEALARGDCAEADRLADTCPQYTYRLPDCEYAMRTIDLMGLAALATAWAWDSAYRALAAQTAMHRLDDLCRGSEAKLQRLLEARNACIAEVKGIYAGWEQFCEHIGVGAELVLRVSGCDVTEKPWATGAGTEHVVPSLQTKEGVFGALMECWNGDRPVSIGACSTEYASNGNCQRIRLAGQR
ncbi:MAG: hypothetical protein ACRED0_02880 [Gammaproteobacteria bacterium]